MVPCTAIPYVSYRTSSGPRNIIMDRGKENNNAESMTQGHSDDQTTDSSNFSKVP